METELHSPQAAMATPDERLLAELGVAASQMEMAIDDLFEKKGPSDHSANNWASEIGHPCARNLVYCRTHWRDRTPLDIDALYRVEAGSDEERKIKHKLEAAGFEVFLAQQHFSWPEYQISGRIDGKVMAPIAGKGRQVPIEVKMINPMFWDKTRTIEDVRTSRNWWIRKYVSQLNLYLFMDGAEGGFLILCSPGRRPRILPMLPNYDLADADLAKATIVNKHVLAGTLPEPMPYDPSVCGMCGFSHLCPQLKALGASWMEIRDEDVPMLEFYLELKEQKKRFEELHSKLIGDNKKPGLYFGKNAISGGIEISSAPRRMTKYDVPAEVKAEYKETYEITTTSIERVV
jgi:CRISPR/Cas system-associated exonuclease Cas4 (RecB family)